MAFYEPSLGILGAAEEPASEVIERMEGRELVAASGKRFSVVDDGSGLRTVPAVRAFWFAWADHYPKTRVAGRE